MDNSSKCPYCGEWIKAEAQKCRYCGEWLPEHKQAERDQIFRDRDSMYQYEWERYKAWREYYRGSKRWGCVTIEILLIAIYVGIATASWWYFALNLALLYAVFFIPYLRKALGIVLSLFWGGIFGSLSTFLIGVEYFWLAFLVFFLIFLWIHIGAQKYLSRK